jgi:hypothetical protein
MSVEVTQLYPYGQTPPGELSEPCRSKLNRHSFDSPLNALHESTKGPKKIRG